MRHGSRRHFPADLRGTPIGSVAAADAFRVFSGSWPSLTAGDRTAQVGSGDRILISSTGQSDRAAADVGPYARSRDHPGSSAAVAVTVAGHARGARVVTFVLVDLQARFNERGEVVDGPTSEDRLARLARSPARRCSSGTFIEG